MTPKHWTAFIVALSVMLAGNLSWWMYVSSSSFPPHGVPPSLRCLPREGEFDGSESTARLFLDVTSNLTLERLAKVQLVVHGSDLDQTDAFVASWAWMFDEPRFLLSSSPSAPQHGIAAKQRASHHGRQVVELSFPASASAAVRFVSWLDWECSHGHGTNPRAMNWTLVVGHYSFVVAHRLAGMFDELLNPIKERAVVATDKLDSNDNPNEPIAWSAGVLISRAALVAMCQHVSTANASAAGSERSAFVAVARRSGVVFVAAPKRLSTRNAAGATTGGIAGSVAVFSGVGTSEPMVSTGILAYDILKLNMLVPKE